MADIGFNYVPANQRIPGIYPEVEGDIPGQPPQWTLMIGQSQTGLVPPNAPILVSSVASAVRHFGAGSPLASMVERYLASDPNGTLWVMGYKDSTDVAAKPAKGTITFSGTQTEDGVLHIYVAGRLVSVPVSTTDTVTDIATNVSSAINNYFDANELGLKRKKRQFMGVKMPVTATHAAGVVTLTANFMGTMGNHIDVQLNYLGTAGRQEKPDGLVVTIEAIGVTQAGVKDPDITGLSALLGDTQYDFIVQPWTDDATGALPLFKDMMADDVGRWSPSRRVYGHVFTARQFVGNGSTAVDFGVAQNDRHLTVVAYENSSPTPPYDVASSYAGAFAASSRIDPARPTQTLPVHDVLAPQRHQRFSSATRQTLLGCGLALMDYDPDYSCKILRAVTTYQLDVNGSPDIAYRDTETLYTLMAVVRQMTADWGAAFPRAKIVDDEVGFGPGINFNAGLPDQPVVTIKSGKAVLIASYSRMANGKGQAIWLTDAESFAKGLILQRNTSDPTRLDALLPIVLASGLRVTAMKVDFALQASS